MTWGISSSVRPLRMRRTSLLLGGMWRRSHLRMRSHHPKETLFKVLLQGLLGIHSIQILAVVWIVHPLLIKLQSNALFIHSHINTSVTIAIQHMHQWARIIIRIIIIIITPITPMHCFVLPAMHLISLWSINYSLFVNPLLIWLMQMLQIETTSLPKEQIWFAYPKCSTKRRPHSDNNTKRRKSKWMSKWRESIN